MPDAPRRPPGRRALLQALWLLLVGGLLPAAGWPRRAAAQAREPGVELGSLALQREDGALTVEFSARVRLARAVEDALRRGVPVYFVAEATLYRRRWYWRDERVARIRRTWRVAFQPLTATWRVGLGGLTQAHGSLAEALAAASTAGRWRLAGLDEIEPGASHYVRLRYELDASKLPSPMQIGIEGQPDWVLRAERELPLE
jgi:hypothetical protein